jgi:molybdopterin converting factor subunit 1
MIVRVRLFAAAKELAGTDVLEVQVPEGTTVADLRRSVVDRAPKLEMIVRHSLWAVGTEYVADDVELHANVDVALIPPVSGG